MKKTISLPKKQSINRHKFEPVKPATFPTDGDTPSLTPLTTTHHR